jgi:WD40 repeat protein
VIARDLGDSDALALTKDGKFLASAGMNNTIRIFETATGKEVLPAQFVGDQTRDQTADDLHRNASSQRSAALRAPEHRRG